MLFCFVRSHDFLLPVFILDFLSLFVFICCLHQLKSRRSIKIRQTDSANCLRNGPSAVKVTMTRIVDQTARFRQRSPRLDRSAHVFKSRRSNFSSKKIERSARNLHSTRLRFTESYWRFDHHDKMAAHRQVKAIFFLFFFSFPD